MSRQRQLILPHRANNILCKGRITVGLHILIYAGVETVTVVGYDMKCPFTVISGFGDHCTPLCGTIHNRLDLGRHVYLLHVPLLE